MSNPPKLVIFDCDGVLVDSEGATNEAISRNLAGYGLDLSPEECVDKFVGGTMANVGEKVRAMGVALPGNWIDLIYEDIFARLREGVDIIPGIEALLDRLDAESIPYCVGSNGPMDKMAITLVATGLMERLSGRIYSPHDIGMEHAKPAPGLYLHASRTMGFAPSQSVVIEDSVNGAKGARAAGIRCFGYTRDTDAGALQSVGATPFSDMSELPMLMGLGS